MPNFNLKRADPFKMKIKNWKEKKKRQKVKNKPIMNWFGSLLIKSVDFIDFLLASKSIKTKLTFYLVPLIF